MTMIMRLFRNRRWDKWVDGTGLMKKSGNTTSDSAIGTKDSKNESSLALQTKLASETSVAPQKVRNITRWLELFNFRSREVQRELP